MRYRRVLLPDAILTRAYSWVGQPYRFPTVTFAYHRLSCNGFVVVVVVVVVAFCDGWFVCWSNWFYSDDVLSYRTKRVLKTFKVKRAKKIEKNV